MDKMISVELVYGLAEDQKVENLLVPKSTTIWDAIINSKTYQEHSELHDNKFSFGVFGKERQPDYLLSANDRIEIYRNLQQDPKDRRKSLL